MSNSISNNEFVNQSCLDGLEVLKECNLVSLKAPQADIFAVQPDHGTLPADAGTDPTADQSKESNSSTQQKSSWATNDKISFDNRGYVVALDLGGKRLHRGLKCDPSVFGSFTKLTTLSLAGTDLPLKDMLAVLSQITKSIECVYLGGNGLGPRGAEAISKSELFANDSSSSKLNKLDMRYNDIGDVGIAAISAAITNTMNLQYLYMEGNAIADEGCVALSKLLSSHSCSIQELYLGGNRIGPAGARSLAACLRTNQSISKIYLEGNQIGDEGAAAFCEILEELKGGGTSGLKHLYCDNNNVGKEVSKRLAKALRNETPIEDI